MNYYLVLALSLYPGIPCLSGCGPNVLTIASYTVIKVHTSPRKSTLFTRLFFFPRERVGFGHKTRAQPVHVGGITDYII